MKKYLLCCMLCMALSAAAAGCSSQNNQVETETDEEFRVPDEEAMGEKADLYEAEEENPEDAGELVTSEDGMYQVLVPSEWKLCKNKIDDAMLFEMQGETEEQYIGILVMDELSYGEIDIEEFVDAYAESGSIEYANAVVSEKTVADVNGNDAYSLRISGAVDGESYTNQLYVVKYDQETVVFTACMNAESESAVMNVFEDVVYSFEKILTSASDMAEGEATTENVE